eukprot:10463647-Alexandrium_andersonii.AAC.1
MRKRCEVEPHALVVAQQPPAEESAQLAPADEGRKDRKASAKVVVLLKHVLQKHGIQIPTT